MRKESPELLVMARSLGNQLAALREAAGIVQQQVGRRTGYSRSSVAKAESGRQLLTREFWQIAELLKAEGALLASYEQVRVAKQGYEAKCREAELAQAYAEARAHAQTLRAASSSSCTEAVPGAGGLVVSPGQAMHPTASTASPAGTADCATPADHERAQDSAGELASRRFSGSVAGKVPADRDAEVRATLAHLLCEWIGAMNRRELIELLGRAAAIIAAASPTMVAALNTDEVERLARAVVSPGRVDTKVIDHLEAIFREIKRREDTLGSHAVLNTAVAELGLVHDLLGECPDALRPRLLSVYSDMSTSIGYYYFDCEDVENAVYHWDRARSAAQNAKNIELSIYALGNMSYAAAWQGKNHTVIDLVAAAQSLANRTGDPLMRVCVEVEAARSYSLDGQYRACMVELEKAADCLLSVGKMPEGSPAYWYNEGWLASQKSRCLLSLGKLREAAVSAREAVVLYDKLYVNIDSLASCLLNLANTLIQCDEIDESAHVIGDAAGLVAKICSVRLVKELRMTRAQMQPRQDARAVKELDDHLVAYGLL